MRSVLDFFKSVFCRENLLHKDNFIIGILIYAFILGLDHLPFSMSFLDPMGDAFEDVEITDVVYSQMGKNLELRMRPDSTTIENTDVVVINVGGLGRSRRDIAAMVNAASMGGAKVVALDVFFEYRKKDTLGDIMLQEAFRNVENLVLVNELMDYDSERGEHDSLKTTLPFFNEFAINGFANMVTNNEAESNNDFNVCRKFLTKSKSKSTGEQILSFPATICQLYDSSSIGPLLKRGNLEEQIDFAGNIAIPVPGGMLDFLLPEFYRFDKIQKWDKPHFKVVEHNNAINAFYMALGMDVPYPNWGGIDLDVFKNKIVLIGYVGDRIDIDTGEDKFFTPLNEKYVGKANRDMYGIVVHANIISTILGGRYTTTMSDWQMHLLGIFVVYLVFAMFRPIYDDFKVWYDGVTKTMGLLLSMFILFLIGWLFVDYNYQLRFGAIYFGCILLAGDFLEIYYGLIRNVARKVRNKFVYLRNKNN